MSESPSAHTPAAAPFSFAYRGYALGLLVVVYVFNFIDRSILGILIQPIKDDLQVSDTAMGFLGGIAFAIFYTALGIPLARIADRSSRRNLLAICLAFWSAATALCGYAQSFMQLLLARIGVAVGEAGGSPPSHSMISDMFPPERRATALAIYALGIPIGTMIGNRLGGWISDAYTWRDAFLIVGLPGLALALIVRLTLREPVRGQYDGGTGVTPGEAPPVGEVFAHLWRRRSFRFLALGAALHAFVGYGVTLWIAPLFERLHGISRTSIGQALFYLGFASIAGTLLGGYLGDRLGARDRRWLVWLPGIATLVSVPFSAYAYLVDTPQFAFWVLAVPYVLGAYYLGPTFSLTQSMVPPQMRAVAAALLLFVLNIIGLGLGPQFTGLISDVLNLGLDYSSAEALRWSMIFCLGFNVLSAVFYLMAARTLADDLTSAPH
ncbi:MAG: MFS transporter [Pseudomonadota bacterium]